MTQKDYYWDEFLVFAVDRGINLEHEDDWSSWWEDWKYAIDVERRVVGKEDE